MDKNEEQYTSRFGRACKACGFVRYWSQFARSSTDPTGFEDVCVECKHTRTGTWYAQKQGAQA